MNVIANRRSLRLPLAALLVGVAVVAWAPPAGADNHCSFVADPPTAQFRGFDVKVTGSFVNDPSSQFGVMLSDGWGAFGPTGKMLEPLGVTTANGSFNHTVTIPNDHPLGQFELMVLGSGGAFNLKWCAISYTVMQLALIPIITTTTTLPVAAPTTTTTTTTATTTTTTTTTVPEETTTTVEETTTTTEAPEETTTTVDEDDDDLFAADEIGGSEVPGWMIALLVAMALALVGLGGYVIGQRNRAAVAGADTEPSPPPPAVDQ